MKKHFGAVLGILIVFAWSGLAAEKKMHACSLLTSSEVGSAVRGQVGPFQESDIVIPEGPSKGETMGVCMWPIDGQGMVSVNIIRALQGAQRAAGLAGLNQTFDMLKAQGWTEEKKEFSNAKCAIMTPPSSETDAPISTGCIAEAKGMGISVGSMNRKKMAIEEVKALLDKVIGRLH